MTQTKPSVLVLANCTHASIELALRNSELFGTVESAALFQLDQVKRDQLDQRLGEFDFIFTLDHSSAFGVFATEQLKRTHSGKVVSAPTPFFAGLMPDMAYVRQGGGIMRSQGLMLDYQSALVLLECRSGLTPEEIATRYENGTAFERIDVEGFWGRCLAELEDRDRESDIHLAPFINNRIHSGQIAQDFMTFNHPGESLINHVVAGFIRAVLPGKTAARMLSTDEHNLNRGARWPIHPCVAERLGLKDTGPVQFRRPLRLGGDVYCFRTFAFQSAQQFLSGDDLDSYHIQTPNYLKFHMH